MWAWVYATAPGCFSSSGVCVGLCEAVLGTTLWWAAYGDHPDLASACFSRYPSRALNFCPHVHGCPVSLFTHEMEPKSSTFKSSVFKRQHFKYIGDCGLSSGELRNNEVTLVYFVHLHFQVTGVSCGQGQDSSSTPVSTLYASLN